MIRDVSCDLVDVDALPSLGSTASSVRAWQQILRDEVEIPLPLAAHGEVDPTGTAMTTAGFARTALRACLATEQLLQDRLHARLRPYQVRGISWLAAAAESEGGAILADEMGLGKTVQAVGLLALRAETGPQLVVCPTSLVTNWAHEIARFAPGLTVHAGRISDAPDTAGSVTITSYARLRLGVDVLAARSWATTIYDEAQALKNTRTQLSRAARRIDTQARIALTGTPIENSLDELWAILRVVAPSVFPHRAVFRRRSKGR